MGLLRPEGVLSAITTKEGWEKLGYEVEGDFRRLGTTITLHRPRHNSPNATPELSDKGVLSFDSYPSRSAEVAALVERVSFDLSEGLSASRNLLIVTLGDFHSAKGLQQWLTRALAGRGIPYFIPGARRPNDPEPKWPENDPNSFWGDGAVTISRIHSAKGNEADVVYVLGLDNVAVAEHDVNRRNQIFVALTRSRGWAHLSGVGEYGLFDEVRRAIRCGETLSFSYTKAPQRQLDDA
jgi:superfamily I DNA and RNA helicase